MSSLKIRTLVVHVMISKRVVLGLAVPVLNLMPPYEVANGLTSKEQLVLMAWVTISDGRFTWIQTAVASIPSVMI